MGPQIKLLDQIGRGVKGRVYVRNTTPVSRNEGK